MTSVDLVGELHQYGGLPERELPPGATEKFQAIANYDDKHWENKSSETTWSTNLICPTSEDPGSSGDAIATISSDGTVTAVNRGTVYVVAVYSTFIGCFSLTVSGAALTSIEVTPTLPSSPAGLTKQFTATGIYADGTTADITTSVVWASANAAVASILNTSGHKGLATALTPGVSAIVATVGSVSGSTDFTVTNALLVSLVVTPTNPSIPLGLTEQFTATGTYTDNTTQNLSDSVVWTSSDRTVATVNIHGLATSLLVGSTTVQAAISGLTSTSTLTVTSAVLASIALNPLNSSVVLGLNKQYTATGTYTDGSTADLTSTVTWSSSNTSQATISNAVPTNGLAHSVSSGSTVITAQSGSITQSTNLTVTAATLVSLAVTPVNPSIAKGLTQQFTATGTYTDSSTQDITTSVVWTTSDGTVATISNAVGTRGLATGVSPGTATMTATLGAVSNTSDLTVTPAVLQSFTVSPQGASFSKTQTKQYTATGTYSDNSVVDITNLVTWSSSSAATATISNAVGSQGLASGVSVGFVRFTAIIGSLRATANATITP